jgi:hypothetical protein
MTIPASIAGAAATEKSAAKSRLNRQGFMACSWYNNATLRGGSDFTRLGGDLPRSIRK